MHAVLSHKDNYREALVDWLESLKDIHGITISEIARRANLSESTLTRFMSEDGPKNRLRERSLGKIEQAFQTRRPPMPTGPDASSPTFETGHDATVGACEIARSVIKAAESASAEKGGIEFYGVVDGALDLAGYLSGDIVVVDRSIPPRSGDVVCIRYPSQRAGRHAVSLRIYDTPFLVAHSSDKTLRRPMLIEPGRVEIIGVITTAMRSGSAT